MNETTILYFGEKMKVGCDGNCIKAWGINTRAKVQLSDDIDDYAFLSDSELGNAPIDPGTCEGRDAKPLSPYEFPNRWCVRECERCAKSKVGKSGDPLEYPDFSARFYNIKNRER